MEIGAYEAKTKFSSLLKRAAKGEAITITKNGTPIADLVPHKRNQTDVKKLVEEMIAFRKGRKLGKRLTIRDLINEGRR